MSAIFSCTDVITEWECLRKKWANEESPKKEIMSRHYQEEKCTYDCDSVQDTDENEDIERRPMKRPRTPDYEYPENLEEGENTWDTPETEKVTMVSEDGDGKLQFVSEDDETMVIHGFGISSSSETN